MRIISRLLDRQRNILEDLVDEDDNDEEQDDVVENEHGTPLDIKHQNLQVWSRKLSALTAGFLPGDLSRIVSRAFSIHAGEMAQLSQMAQLAKLSQVVPSSSIQSQEASDIQTQTDVANNEPTLLLSIRGGALSWRSMLSAVASLPPGQLQKLSRILAGGSGSGSGSSGFVSSTAQGGEQLSWDHFGGYEEVKSRLKKLLYSSTSKLTSKSSKSSRESTPTAIAPSIGPSIKGINPNNGPSLQQVLKLGSDGVRGILLHGPPGCGKSYLAKIIAAEVSPTP
jgi:ATPase family associated with various cellular activities (AAA)